ncbi:MAG: AAA family ATPase [Phycisphaerales bacterium]|jgi:MoxR-like ATPase
MAEDTNQLAGAAQAFRADFEAVRNALKSAVVGQTSIIEGVLIALFCGGHVLLEGVPGVGKTLLVRSLAQATGLEFSRVQFTPDLMPADITGTTIVVETESAGERRREFRFQKGPVFSQILLADEINRATPKTQSALLEAMQERGVTVGGVTHRLPDPFLVLATQNPVEQEGTYPLPEAQLDRFFFKLLVTPPSRIELNAIVDLTTGVTQSPVRPVLDTAKLLSHQAMIRRAVVAPHVRDYAVRMVLATHPAHAGGEKFATPMAEKYVRLGASPRAAQTLILAAKCKAFLDGRASVSIDDLKSVATASLRHRLILNFEASAEGVSADAIISNLISTLPVEAVA